MEKLTDSLKEDILADHDIVARLITGYNDVDPDVMHFNPDPIICSEICKLPDNAVATLFLISSHIENDYLLIVPDEFWQHHLNYRKEEMNEILILLEKHKMIKRFITKSGEAIYPNPVIMFLLNKDPVISARYYLDSQESVSVATDDL